MVEKHVYTYLTYKHGGFWGWFSSLVLTTEKRTGRETKHAETQPDAQRSRNASQARLPQKTPEFCDRTHGYIYIYVTVYIIITTIMIMIIQIHVLRHVL